MNWSTTTLPCRLDRLSVWPFWSVRVKPGARSAGIGLSTMRFARLVDTLAGMPDTRGWADAAWSRWSTRYEGMATAATTSTVSAVASSEDPGQAAAPGRRGSPPAGWAACTCSGVLELTGNASCLVTAPS